MEVFLITIIRCSRSPRSLVHPKKIKNSNGAVETNGVLENVKPVATRHIILIRHGQYNLDGRNDDERFLTKLGEYV